MNSAFALPWRDGVESLENRVSRKRSQVDLLHHAPVWFHVIEKQLRQNIRVAVAQARIRHVAHVDDVVPPALDLRLLDFDCFLNVHDHSPFN
jgi:hypothetical protein